MNKINTVLSIAGIFVLMGQNIFASETGAQTLAQANNKFGLSLLKISRKDTGKNQLISPLSAYQALSMVTAGASGETKNELVKLLSLEGISEETLEPANRALLSELRKDKYVTTAIANSLWVREIEGLDVNPDYRAKIFKAFEGEVRTEDFNDPAAVNEINRWAKKKTQGKISEFINEISPETVAILLNATYFKGAWASEFTSKDTGAFHLENGSNETVDFMVSESHYQHVQNNKFEAIKIPYKTLLEDKYTKNSTFHMWLLVPNSQTSLSNLISGLDMEQLNATLGSLNEAQYLKGSLTLPKFSFKSELPLKEAMQALGVGRVFTNDSELFGILDSKDGLVISEAKQAAYISVDEKGTEAAAVTGISLVPAGIEKSEFNMVVDRPFLFAIQDESTGAILFMGTVANPKAQ